MDTITLLYISLVVRPTNDEQRANLDGRLKSKRRVRTRRDASGGTAARRDGGRRPTDPRAAGEGEQARRLPAPADHRGRLQRDAVPHGPRGRRAPDGPRRRRARRQGVRRPEEHDVPARLEARLGGRPLRRAVQDQQPEREALVLVRAELHNLGRLGYRWNTPT